MATFLACLLAMGGAGWGLLLLPLLVWGAPRSLALFGPGYLVTVGYFMRAAALTPSVPRRRMIWGASALVQGAWFCAATWGVVFYGGIHGGAWFIYLWWAFAFASSIYCLFTDTRPLRLPG